MDMRWRMALCVRIGKNVKVPLVQTSSLICSVCTGIPLLWSKLFGNLALVTLHILYPNLAQVTST